MTRTHTRTHTHIHTRWSQNADLGFLTFAVGTEHAVLFLFHIFLSINQTRVEWLFFFLSDKLGYSGRACGRYYYTVQYVPKLSRFAAPTPPLREKRKYFFSST